jgi:hypothetical protein
MVIILAPARHTGPNMLARFSLAPLLGAVEVGDQFTGDDISIPGKCW